MILRTLELLRNIGIFTKIIIIIPIDMTMKQLILSNNLFDRT